MAGYTVLADVSRHLLERVREAVCPGLISSREQVALGGPDGQNRDALLLLYLYSIQEYSDYVPERTVSPSGMVYGAPLPVTLKYALFLSRHAQAPLDGATEQQLFGRLLVLLYGGPVINIGAIHSEATAADEPVSITFSRLDDRQKQELWTGFSEPLRPALYFEAGPLLLVASAREPSRVREVEGGLRPK